MPHRRSPQRFLAFVDPVEAICPAPVLVLKNLWGNRLSTPCRLGASEADLLAIASSLQNDRRRSA